MLDFQRYQIAFTAHLRNPTQHKRPAHVTDARMAIYREIVFNNIFSSVSACFPVCKNILGVRAWRKLVRLFFANHQAISPIFREIPQQFLQFINDVKDLPAYLQQLAHYEWVELAIGTQQTEVIKLSKNIDLINEKPILAPANMLLEYDYAVHKISKRHIPNTTEKTCLLVFRNNAHQVKFIELNAMTFQLLTLIQEHEMTGKQALIKLAKETGHPDAEAIIQFGMEILNNLANQQAIAGSKKIS